MLSDKRTSSNYILALTQCRVRNRLYVNYPYLVSSVRGAMLNFISPT